MLLLRGLFDSIYIYIYTTLSCRKSEYFGLANTATGGHCPFFEGILIPRNWAERAALEFVQALVQLRKDEEKPAH
jgi:predicted alpha/beta-fold hydrolase